MKNVLLAASLASMLVGIGQAHADMVCNMTDTQGSALTYVFGPNSYNANGTFGGTLVETGFDKNGTSVTTAPGRRPVWIYAGFPDGSFNLASRNAPGWWITVGPRGKARLNHNGRYAAFGSCQGAASNAGETAGNVGDRGL